MSAPGVPRPVRLAGRALAALLVPAALLAGWEALSRLDQASRYAFVPLAEIARGWREVLDSGELLLSLSATLQHALSGLVLGSLAGLAAGTLLGTSRLAERLLGPLYHGLRQVPLLGLVPLIGLWFGTGDPAKLIVISLAAFYPVTLAVMDGLRSVERSHLELGQALVLGPWQTFRYILLPAAVPFIVTGLLQALAFSWIATVGSEILFTGGAGLGSFMQQGQAAGRMELVIIGVTAIAVTGLFLNQVVAGTGRRLLRWREANH